MKKITTVKGTRDFYPEQMALRNCLYKKVRAASQSFGYQEWEAPFIETLDLYAAKSGRSWSRSSRLSSRIAAAILITLRPELTPSLARMIAAKTKRTELPGRWWSFGPFWRYEQPQKGRTREFFQWNVDMLGVASPEADAELIAVAASFLRWSNLTPERATIYRK